MFLVFVYAPLFLVIKISTISMKSFAYNNVLLQIEMSKK